MPTGLGDEKLWLCPSLDDSADDISGNGNHGTYNGGMGTVADTSNGGTRAYDFEGSAKRIDLPNSLQSAFFGNHSVAAWIRIESDLYNADPKVTILGSTSVSGRWVHFIYDKQFDTSTVGGLEMCADDGTNNGCVGDTGTDFWMETDQWFHVAGVRDYSSSQVKLFVNGSLLHTGSFTASTMSAMDQGLHIGWSGLHGYAGNTSSGSHAYIRYDDIRIFDRELTSSEITSLASKRGYEVPAAGDIPHALSSPFHPLG
jgi:hypothetical protein